MISCKVGSICLQSDVDLRVNNDLHLGYIWIEGLDGLRVLSQLL